MTAKKKILITLLSLSLLIGEILIGPAGILEADVIKTIRLPRLLVAIIVGGGLAVSGATFQSILRNPLADPYIMGSASGAAIGVISSEILGLRNFAPLFAFIFSLMAAFISVKIAGKTGGSFSSGGLVLAGFSVNILASSIVIAYFYIAGKDTQNLMSFLFGYLGENDYKIILITGIGVLFLSYLLLRLSWIMDAASMGEEKLTSLGINAFRLNVLFASIASLIVAITVSLAGIVGFAGLVAPNAARILVGATHRRLIPVSFLLGALFIIAGDIIGKILFSPFELPAGVVTSIIGIPVFIKIIYRQDQWK